MKYRFLNKKSDSIDITPLLDIVFLVLIFFMIGASFDLNRALQMSVPETFTSEGSIQENKILIEIDQRGSIAVNGETAGIYDLSKKISSLRTREDVMVYIMADKNVAYNNVIEVMDILKVLGIQNISLVTGAKKSFD